MRFAVAAGSMLYLVFDDMAKPDATTAPINFGPAEEAEAGFAGPFSSVLSCAIFEGSDVCLK